MAAENIFRLSESDSLLCYHGPMLYEAKCLKRRMETDGGNKAQYFIHYKGWKSKWDEWINEDQVLDVNTDNMRKMAELKELHSKSRKSAQKLPSSVVIKQKNRGLPIKTTTSKVNKKIVTKVTDGTYGNGIENDDKSRKSARKLPSSVVIKQKNRGDSLLCYHGPMLYEATCLKRRMVNNGSNKAQYFIHYKRWNSKWDEWVNEDRVLDVNTDNMRKMAELKELHSKSRKSAQTLPSSVVIKQKNRGRPIKTTTSKVNKKIVKKITDGTYGNGIENDDKSRKSARKLPSSVVIKQKNKGRPIKTTTSKVNKKIVKKITDGTYGNGIENDDMVGTSMSTVTMPTTSKVNKKIVTKVTDGTYGNGIENDDMVGTSMSTVTMPTTNKVNKEIVTKVTDETDSDETENDDMVGTTMSTVINIKDIPYILKLRLRQDYIMIHKQQKKMKFFSINNTIDLLLRGFEKSTSTLSLKEQDISKSISLTLIQYFNWYIHTQLLYNEERKNNIMKKAEIVLCTRIQTGLFNEYPLNKNLFITQPWHYVYGPSFLLRLLVQWPYLKVVENEKYDRDHMIKINEYFGYFLIYLEDNYAKYFSDQDY